MSDSEGESDLDLESVFPEPPRPPSPQPTTAIYTRTIPAPTRSEVQMEQADHGVWSEIQIQLVGSHPLWGHYLWNASRSFASYLDTHTDLYRGRCVLELGAGGGLPGIVTVKNGAKSVFLTDYPDTALLENLKHNVQKNVAPDFLGRVHVEGYVWGQTLEPVLEAQQASIGEKGFDLIIMSDLIFNHSQHDALLRTSELALKSTSQTASTETAVAKSQSLGTEPCILVFFSHHRPHLAHRDMEFFTKAEERGWTCEKILTEKFPPMFPEDPGEEEVRATVHGWRLVRSHELSHSL